MQNVLRVAGLGNADSEKVGSNSTVSSLLHECKEVLQSRNDRKCEAISPALCEQSIETFRLLRTIVKSLRNTSQVGGNDDLCAVLTANIDALHELLCECANASFLRPQGRVSGTLKATPEGAGAPELVDDLEEAFSGAVREVLVCMQLSLSLSLSLSPSHPPSPSLSLTLDQSPSPLRSFPNPNSLHTHPKPSFTTLLPKPYTLNSTPGIQAEQTRSTCNIQLQKYQVPKWQEMFLQEPRE